MSNFLVNDNVIRGEIKTIPKTDLNFGQIILNMFQENLNHVFQVNKNFFIET